MNYRLKAVAVERHTRVQVSVVSGIGVQVSAVSASRFHLKLPAKVITESQTTGTTNEMTRKDPMLTELDDSTAIGSLTMTFESTVMVESVATDADMNATRMPLMVTSAVDAMSAAPMATRSADAETELVLVASPAPNTTRRAETAKADADEIDPAPMATRSADALRLDCDVIAAEADLMTSAATPALDAAGNSTDAETTRAPVTDTVLVLLMSAAPRLTPNE